MVGAEMLERFSVLAGIPPADLGELGRICEIEDWSEGQVFTREGTPVDKLRLVLRGKAELDKQIQLGRHGSIRRHPFRGNVVRG